MQNDVAVEHLRRALREHRQQAGELLINAQNLEVAISILDATRELAAANNIVHLERPEDRLTLPFQSATMRKPAIFHHSDR